MKEVLYATEQIFLEQYLKEKAAASAEDVKAASDLWGKPIPEPGTAAAVNEIYSVEGDTARIRVEGPLSIDGPDSWDLLFGYGGASYITIQAAMERAKNDRIVTRVIFDMDSNGGTINGLDETWRAHKELAAVKPTEVRAGSMLASAAYWLSCPAKKIYAASPTSRIGSIGILVATYDLTAYQEKLGIKKVIITSSNAPDKRPDVSTEQGRNTIKAQLDAMERIFYARVSEGRGVTNEHIAEHFGRGGLLVAKDPSAEHEDAVRSGMIDGLTAANDHYMQQSSFEGKNTPALAGNKQEGQIMKLSEYLEANPSAAAEIDRIKAEAKEAGRVEAKAEYSARVERVMPVIQSGVYPVNIKTIACHVLAGKEEMAAFTASVATYDNMTEAANSAAAVAHTAELDGITAEAPDGKSAAEKELDAALQAEVDKRKVK